MNIGEQIKNLRIKNGLTQEELANRCDLTKGFISLLERNLTSPSIATLMDILETLGTNIKDFFNHIEDEKIVFTKEDIFVKQNAENKEETHWLIPTAQKNMMEPILLNLEPGGKTNEHKPHDGEEFGYVFCGSIFVHLGKKQYRVRKGESFYFSPNTVHYVSNEGKNTASLIWISCPPSF